MRAALLGVACLVLAACGGSAGVRTGGSEAIGIGDDGYAESTPLSIRSNDVLMRAIGLVGTPYRYGGNSPEGGFDCSGLVQYVYGLQGLKLPRTTSEQHNEGDEIDLDDAEPGDLLFYRFGLFGIDHVAIYLGDGQAVHAPASGRHVIVAPVGQRWWMDRYVDAVRIIH